MNTNNIRQLLALQLLEERFTTDKSGVKTVELIGASFIADEPLIFGSENAEYIQNELDWYISQSLNVNDIPGKTPAIWNAVATPEGFINSNYGYLVFSEKNYSQYEKVLVELIRCPNSRRAVTIYTRPTMHTDWCSDGMSDFICTNTVQYLIRDSLLHAVVQMRSNDSIFGYKNDYAWQKYVLDKLVADYNAWKIDPAQPIAAGTITWQVGSLHVYSRHFKYITDYISEFDVNPIPLDS